MRTYVKHVLAYGIVSEQARKSFCACDVREGHNLRVTVHFARPRGIFVDAQSLCH
jgi:hypothetical protein